MNLWHQFAKLWKRPEERESPYSIVLLLREPHFFTESELMSAGERGWRTRFDGKTDPMYFVVQKADVTMLKAGPHVVQLVHGSEPYLSEREEISRRLPRREQKRAWQEHNAWAALELWDRNPTKEGAYVVLAKFALQLTDSNCCAVLLAKDDVLMPNDGAAEEGLQRLLRREHW